VGRWVDVPQNTDEWLALRLGKVTASNAATFMANDGRAFGDPAKRYALQLALEQLTGKKAEHSFSNEHMERGHEQEPIARMLYEREHYCTVTNGGFYDCGAYGDSPDGLIGETGVYEGKAVIAPVHFATLQRGNFDPAYRWQLVSHLDCSGRDWCDFASYCSDFPQDQQLAVYRLHRDECQEELKRLRERRAEFIKLVHATKVQINPELAWPKAA
jgi:hypothetical protein